MSDSDGLTPLPTAARRLHRHPNTLKNWEKRGLLDLVTIAGRRYVRDSQLEALIAQGDDTSKEN